jgi:hypothetical protein
MIWGLDVRETKVGTVTWTGLPEEKERIDNYKHAASALKKRSDVSI